MKFGVREICDVVLKAKAPMKVGKKVFYANEPVLYFDTLKSSTMEGASTTVYAQGGRGNTRLVAWEGERTVTFTMEDALISPEGFMILSGAGLMDATSDKQVIQHITETVDKADVTVADAKITVKVAKKPYLPSDQNENFAYAMFVYKDEIITEPYIAQNGQDLEAKTDSNGEQYYDLVFAPGANNITKLADEESHADYAFNSSDEALTGLVFDSVIVDYYTAHSDNAQQIEITAESFGGNFYLEAATLFRNQNGVDMPAEFIIPNCKIQSNFTFNMASSGDPSTFTFTMDAFPDYTRFDHSKKVLAAIQIINDAKSQDLHRHSTSHEAAHDALFS